MADNITLDANTGAPLGEISQAPPAMEVFLDKHQMKLIALAVILAIVAVVAVVMRGIKEGNEETAGMLLTKAESLSELQSVVKNHGGTEAAFSAKILLAEKQWEDGQQDDAIATLRAFVDADRDHPARPSAEASLAAKLRSQGETDEAEELFRDLTEDSDSRYLAAYAWISLGDIEAGKGNAEAAAKAYETVENEFAGSPFSQVALTRRLLVKAKAPVEVAAPITVPEAKLTSPDDEGGSAPGDASVQDMLDAINSGAGDASANPLLPDQNPSEPVEESSESD